VESYGVSRTSTGLEAMQFVADQLYSQAASPASHTMMFGYTNGCNGYVPSAEAFYSIDPEISARQAIALYAIVAA
jgi:hypothetical protein